MNKNSKISQWSKSKVLDFTKGFDEEQIIKKIDFIGDAFQDTLLLNLLANSLRLQNTKTNDLYVYNIEMNARFGGIVGLHCVAAQEQLYAKVCKDTGLNFEIIPKRSASCLRIRDHLMENYSQGIYENCANEFIVHKNRIELKKAAQKDVKIKLNKFSTNYEKENGESPNKQMISAEKIRIYRDFKKHNITTQDINSGSLMLIRSTTNSASGLHSVFYIGEDNTNTSKHVSFNKEGLFSLFKRNKKTLKLFIADIPRITKLKVKEQTDTFDSMSKKELLEHILSEHKDDVFDFSLEVINKRSWANFVSKKYLNELEKKAKKNIGKSVHQEMGEKNAVNIGSWDIEKTVYRKNLEEKETGKPIITLGHFWSNAANRY